MATTSPSRYSATVDLQLIVDDQVYDVTQTGPNSIILRNPATLPAGKATLIIIVDGVPRKYAIFLATSGSVPSRQIAYF